MRKGAHISMSPGVQNEAVWSRLICSYTLQNKKEWYLDRLVCLTDERASTRYILSVSLPNPLMLIQFLHTKHFSKCGNQFDFFLFKLRNKSLQ
jgi:hypothetical protein